MINIIELSTVQQCLAGKGMSQETLDQVTECLRLVTDPPPLPPPPSGGFAACGGQGVRGPFGWDEWCVDEEANFGMVGPDRWMRRNAKAMRVRLAGATPRGVALPTVGSNHIKFSTTLRFDEDWLIPKVTGGQHLFALGQGPFLFDDGSNSPDHLRLDFSPARDPEVSGVSFKYGLRCLVYEARDGQGRRERWLNFEVPSPIWPDPSEVAHLVVEAKLNASSGELDVAVSYGGYGTIQRSMDIWPGQPNRLGDAAEWGNVDGRAGRVYLGPLMYERLD